VKETTKVWIEFAKRDMASAKLLLSDEYCSNNVLFHCQQAIEKILKAILEEYEIHVPKIHSVIKLYEMLPGRVKESFKIEEEELNLIEEIYINFRYPSEMGLVPNGFPTKERAKNIYELTEGIFNDLLKILTDEG